jgi:hypothetical protein
LSFLLTYCDGIHLYDTTVQNMVFYNREISRLLKYNSKTLIVPVNKIQNVIRGGHWPYLDMGGRIIQGYESVEWLNYIMMVTIGSNETCGDTAVLNMDAASRRSCLPSFFCSSRKRNFCLLWLHSSTSFLCSLNFLSLKLCNSAQLFSPTLIYLLYLFYPYISKILYSLA